MSQDHGKEKEHFNRSARRNEHQALHDETVEHKNADDVAAGEYDVANIETGAGRGEPLEDGSHEGGTKLRDDQDYLEG